MITTSEKGKLDKRDLLRGLIIAAVSGVITFLGDSVFQRGFTFDWILIGRVALFSALGYLTVNWRTKSSVIMTTDEVETFKKVEAKDGEIKVTETKETTAQIDDKKDDK